MVVVVGVVVVVSVVVVDLSSSSKDFSDMVLIRRMMDWIMREMSLSNLKNLKAYLSHPLRLILFLDVILPPSRFKNFWRGRRNGSNNTFDCRMVHVFQYTCGGDLCHSSLFVSKQ